MTGEERRRRDGGRGSRGRLTGVGVGPGDPDLVTVKGVKVLTSADAVFVPVGERGDTGYAERVVLAHVAGHRVRRLTFALGDDAAAGPQLGRRRPGGRRSRP